MPSKVKSELILNCFGFMREEIALFRLDEDFAVRMV